MIDLLPTLKDLLAHQYEAALSALHLSIARCPDELWHAPVAKWKYCTAAFHTVFFADLYLQPTDDEEAVKRQPFHLEHAAEFRDYEELADREPVLQYEKPFVVEYLRYAREKARMTLAGESAETLAGPSGFRRRPCTRAELHVYNIRHIQHHAAQLALRLRQTDLNIEIPWVSHAWRGCLGRRKQDAFNYLDAVYRRNRYDPTPEIAGLCRLAGRDVRRFAPGLSAGYITMADNPPGSLRSLFPFVRVMAASRPWLDASDASATTVAEASRDDAAYAPKGRSLAPQERVHLWVAPIRPGKLPGRAEFQRVGCVQMTGNGATFIWTAADDVERVMLAIGTTSEATYLEARIVQKTPERNATTRVVCEYEKRI